jgi:AcrR family transcriptional regulator
VRPWRGVSASQRTAERRERLIEAALQVFGTAGYAASSVRDVCRAAGLTERYFYESFRNREEVLGALADRIVDDSLDAVTQALDESSGEAEQTVRSAVGRFVDSLVDDPCRARVLLVETVGVSRSAEDRRRQIVGHLAAVTRAALQEALGAAAPASADIDLTARALIGASNELLVAYVRGEVSRDRRKLTEHLAALFLAAAPVSSSGRPSGRGFQKRADPDGANT